ncbi:MAG: ArsR/SmtB family transcription factor [Acidimicrobiia bacterium]
MPVADPELSQVFRALADPTRRSVVEQLGAGPASTSDLARPFDMALPSFTQHLDVLATTGLVTSRKVGRVRIYDLTTEPLAAAEGWLADQRRVWERRLDQLDTYLTRLHQERSR